MAFKTSSKQKLSTISAIASSVGTGASGPTILSVAVTDSSYANLDDTAVSTSGGYIKLIGTGFVTGCIAYVNGAALTTTFVSSTEIRAEVPALANGTYSLMMFNSAGIGAIWATGLTASGFPTVTASSYSNAGNVLNIQLLASGDGTLVYSLQDGSTLPSGVTLSSSGVLSGTASALTSATVVSFTILVNDAQQQTVQQSITLSLTFGDDYFKSTVLAIQANTTPFISDASSNNVVLTPAGSVKADQFNPFQGEGYYSGYFATASDYITTTPITMSATAFTIECWINTTNKAAYAGLCKNGAAADWGTSDIYIIGLDASGNSIWIYDSQASAGLSLNGTTTVTDNKWHHVAFVYNGTDYKLFIDGAINATSVKPAMAQTARVHNIGCDIKSARPWIGHISNFRMVNGVALYTETFTLPTAPLTIVEPAVTYTAPTTVDYLVVAGGGGGGATVGGGGGAGGMLTGTNFAVAANTALIVTVGAGGAGTGVIGVAGGNSVFSTITALGGGAGGTWPGNAGTTGGSGGGSSGADSGSQAASAGTAGQGNAGGKGGNSVRFGGGGGGAGAVGTAGSATGGHGGMGLASSITGISTYYAGGGGGGNDGGIPGNAGLGGGGKGGTSTAYGSAGISNTGGGGGGGGNTTWGNGLSGGSGVVIIRYPDTASPAVTTGNPDIIVSGGYRIYRFTQSGTIKFRNTSSPAVTAAQTVLLTCQSNRFKNNNSTASAITIAGTPKITQVIPYMQPVSTYGSAYFNGTTDYINAITSLNFAMGTGNYTLEAWIYPTVAAGSVLETAGGIQVGWNTTTSTFGIAQRGVVWKVTGPKPALNTWSHVAIVRSGTGTNQTAVYLNGVATFGTDAVDYGSTTNTFTIGNSNSGTANYYTGYISNVRVLKGVTVYTGNFTLPIVPFASTQVADTNITAITGTQTTLLTLQTKSAYNNNTYLETSGYNNLLTPTGTPVQGTFSPFSPAGWSTSFNGSTDALEFPSTYNLSSGASAVTCTVEAWFNTATPATDQTIFAKYANGTDGVRLGLNASKLTTYLNGNTVNITGTTTLLANTWYHVALSGSVGNWKVFLNGVQDGPTFTGSVSLGSAAISQIGRASNVVYFNGSISNVRVTPGTALYTSTFTPSITALPAVTGTALLVCQDNRFVDNSVNNLNTTIVGTPKVQAFSPFKPSAIYDPVLHGGSTYFNGSTDYLTAPVNTNLAFGTGTTVSAMTAECWFYVNTAISTDQTIVSQYASGSAGWSIRVYTSVLRVALTGDTTLITGTTTLTPYTWYHVALSGSAGSWKLFLNGKQESTTQTGSVTMGDAAAITVGRLSNVSYFNGYISNLVITKGVVKYTGSFYVPTAPAARTSSTVLLLDSTSAAIIDASGKNNMRTAGDTKVSTSIEKYGAGSMYFDGTGDYIVAPISNNFNFGTGDFTLEGWFYGTVDKTDGEPIFDFRGAGAGGPAMQVYSSNKLMWYYNSTVLYQPTSLTFTYNTWNHIALVRSSGVTKFYLNGVGAATTYTDTNNYPVSQCVIGSDFLAGGTAYWTGYMDDLRITKGVARYVANFTPPVAISVS